MRPEIPINKQTHNTEIDPVVWAVLAVSFGQGRYDGGLTHLRHIPSCERCIGNMQKVSGNNRKCELKQIRRGLAYLC